MDKLGLGTLLVIGIAIAITWWPSGADCRPPALAPRADKPEGRLQVAESSLLDVSERATRTASGIAFEVMAEGRGERRPDPDDTCVVDYTGARIDLLVRFVLGRGGTRSA